jgi:membrane fusion protein (multidrug efflux system)
MIKKIHVLIFIITALIISCGGEDQAQLPPPVVQVYVTTSTDVPIFKEFIGETLGFVSIDIAARVEGYLEGRHFVEGSEVTKGQLLYTIESQRFEENVAERQSQLAASKVELANAKSNLSRIKPLAAENAISQIDLDAAQAEYEASIEAVKAAKANLNAANIQLGYTKIHSPINGLIGKTEAEEGDLVGTVSSAMVLNTVSDINTILVQFFVTENEYLQAARRLIAETKENQASEAKEGRSDLQLILSDGSVYDYKGKFDFIDRSVDPLTGAILIQASFPNPNQLLRPGLFAKVRAVVERVKDGILVPQRCVIELQGTFSVLVIDENNKVQSRQVQTGPKVKEFWLITEGLKPGDKVIYEGLQKVKEGIVVVPEVVEIKIPDLESI